MNKTQSDLHSFRLGEIDSTSQNKGSKINVYGIRAGSQDDLKNISVVFKQPYEMPVSGFYVSYVPPTAAGVNKEVLSSFHV